MSNTTTGEAMEYEWTGDDCAKVVQFAAALGYSIDSLGFTDGDLHARGIPQNWSLQITPHGDPNGDGSEWSFSATYSGDHKGFNSVEVSGEKLGRVVENLLDCVRLMRTRVGLDALAVKLAGSQNLAALHRVRDALKPYGAE